MVEENSRPKVHFEVPCGSPPGCSPFVKLADLQVTVVPARGVILEP